MGLSNANARLSGARNQAAARPTSAAESAVDKGAITFSWNQPVETPEP
jgi:hypothetical protein